MRRSLWMGGAAGLLLAPGLAAAQAQSSAGAPQPSAQPPAALQEIVVTAQKREERLQNVPIAITAATGATLEKDNIHSVADIQKLQAPGLLIEEQIGTPSLAINMRGVATADVQQATVEQGTALYIDGVYIPRSQGLTGDLTDVDRVEVLRGPQGTLFGRNAEGGALSIFSKRPTGVFGGTIGGEVGDYGDGRAYIHLNLPAFDNISIKLDGYRSFFDGWTKNADTFPGQSLSKHVNFGASDDGGGAIHILWRPTADFSATYSYDQSVLKTASDYLYNVTPTPLSPGGDPDYFSTSQLPLWNDYSHTRANGQSLVLSYQLTPELLLKSITGARYLSDSGADNLIFGQVFPIDAYGTLGAGVIPQATVTSHTFSQEFQAIGTTGQLQYTLGLFYFYERATDDRYTQLSIIIPAGVPPFSIDPETIVGDSFAVVRSNAGAVYGQATWTPPILGDRLKVTLGGRYSIDHKSGVRTSYGGAPLVPYDSPPEIRISRFDPAATVAYAFTPAVNAYIRYAQAFRSGGVSVRSPDFLPYGPELNKQLEIGEKSEFFDHRARLNIAAYHSWIEDQQVNESTDPLNPTIQNIINATGTTNVQGVETEGAVSPFPGLTLGGNYVIQSGSQPKYPCGGCAAEAIIDLPARTGAFTADYTHPLGEVADLDLHLGYDYESRFHASPIAYPGQVWPYSTVNVWNGRVALEKLKLAGCLTTLAVHVDNLFDNHEIVYDTNFGFNDRRPPRAYGVTLNVAF